MSGMRTLGVVLGAIFAFGTVSAPAAFATLEFVASKTGMLKGSATSEQVFNTGGVAQVECSEAATSGKVEALNTTSQLVKVVYGKCKLSGIGGSASVSEADYLFLAANESTDVENLIKIFASSLGVECEIAVEPQSNLRLILYDNLAGPPKTIDELTHVTGIESEITKSKSSSFCGTVGSKSKTGTYKGNSHVELEGGDIEFGKQTVTPDPDELIFSNNGMIQTKSVIYLNNGNVNWDPGTPKLSGKNPGSYLVASSTCTGTFAPGKSCILSVLYEGKAMEAELGLPPAPNVGLD